MDTSTDSKAERIIVAVICVLGFIILGFIYFAVNHLMVKP